MKEFFITILFIAIGLGIPIFIGCLPFLIRDRVRKNRGKRRQKAFEEKVKDSRLLGKSTDFHFTVRLNKSELLEADSTSRSLQQSGFVKAILTIIFLTWLSRSSWEIGGMLLGYKEHLLGSWLRYSTGLVVASYVLWNLWVVPWLVRRQITASSEMEISLATATDYHFTNEGIWMGEGESEQAICPWSMVNYAVIKDDEIHIVFTFKDLIVIPRDSFFHQGDWDSLVEFLLPLAKR